MQRLASTLSRSSLALWLGLLLWPSWLVWAQPAEVGTSTACQATSTNTVTCPHDAGTAVQRVTILGYSARNTATPLTVTYGGEAMTEFIEDHDTGVSIQCRMYYLVDPPTGTNDAFVDVTGGASFIVGLATFAPVDQLVPITGATGNSTSGATSTPANLSPDITSITGTLVIDTVAKRDSSGSLTAGAGQTEQWDTVTVHGTASANVRGGGSTKAGAATVNMEWALGVAERWAICAGSLQPAPASGGSSAEALYPLIQ